jgi:hypothetical protein
MDSKENKEQRERALQDLIDLLMMEGGEDLNQSSGSNMTILVKAQGSVESARGRL